ncbi:MAG TPA: 2-phospho-L-lactate guanylyltransferase [Myxococcota bacterium]|nr:2-phospho-L-lactate guanylyltransferase [Myxococcota bacterium]
MSAAVVPVKALSAGKSRMAAALGRERAAALVLAMLEDVVSALRAVPRLSAVAVVTPDAAVAAAAERAGARPLLGDDPGLNPSIDRAARALGPACEGGLVVVLGDVAGVRAEEVEQVLDALAELGSPGAVLVPARDGGSAVLARNPHDAFPARFGPDSAAAHREAARGAGVPLVELRLPSCELDLDGEEDLRAFLAGPGAGPRTRAVLRAHGA